MKNPSVNYLKIGQAAKALGVSIDTLRRWEKTGKITPIRTPGGTRLYLLSHLKKVNPVSVEDFQAKSLSTEELLKKAGEQGFFSVIPANAGIQLTTFDSELDPDECRDDKIGSFKKSFVTKFLIGSAFLSVITLLLTSWITASYLTNPKETQQFFKNNVASGVLSPFHKLAEEAVAIIDPKKAKELGFNQPEEPPQISDIRHQISDNVLAVTASPRFLEVNADTQINGSLSVRDTINELSLEATPSAGTIALTAGDTTLTVTKDALLDQDVSTVATPTFNTLNLSGTKSQLVFQSGGPTGTLTWTPTATRVITLPDATATLVGKDTTDTLTNKSISGGSNTLTNIPNSALTNSKVTVTAGTNLTGGGDITLGSSITLSLASSPVISGVVSLADGTAAAPALTFTSDTDSGLYRIGANNIGLITAGTATSGITIDANGNVGIGTITPSFQLQTTGNVGVGGSLTVTSLLSANGSAAVTGSLCLNGECKSNWTGAGNYTASNGITLSGVDFQLGGTLTRATGIDISSQNFGFLGGNVGIGTSSPDYNLRVNGTGYFSGFIGIGSSLNVSGNVGIGESLTITSNALFNGGITVGSNQAFSINGDTFTDLTGTNLSVSSGALNVVSNPTFSTSVTTPNLTLTGNNASLTFSGTTPSIATTGTNGFSVFSGGNIGIGTSANLLGTLTVRGAGTSTNITLQTYGSNLTQGLTVLDNGNVGIGTTSPAAKLGILAAGVQNSIVLQVTDTGDVVLMKLIGQASSDVNTGRAFQVSTAGENYARSTFYTDGKLGIGPGNATRDTFLSRSAANTFRISSDGANGTGNLIINGNVGIGTTTVNSKLTVVGNAMISQSYSGLTVPTSGLFVEGNVGIGATTSSNKLDVWGNARITGTLITDQTAKLDSLLIGFPNFTAPANGLAVFGNVGIGTTAAGTFALEVNGDIGPNTDNNRNLGSADRYFANAYIKNIYSGSSGTVGFWGRTGTVLSPATAGDTVAIYAGAGNTSGTIFNLSYSDTATLTGDLTGQVIDLNSGKVNNSNYSVTGLNVTLPAVTDSNPAETIVNIKGFQFGFGTGTAINQTGAGTTIYSGVDITLPALTQTAGTLTANGVIVTTSSSITTGGTANGINIAPTGVGNGTLNALNIGEISPLAGTENAIAVGAGWDNVLKVGSTAVINGAGVVQVAGGGTGIATYNTGDILYASGATTLTNLGIGTSGQVLTTTAGVPIWANINGSSCVNCLTNNPTSTQNLSPTGQATTGLSIRQTSTASPTQDIFNVTSSDGNTKYFYVDKNGVVSTGGVASTVLTLTPGSDNTALTLVGTNVTTQNLAYFNANNAQGTIFNIAYGGSQTLTGSLTGQAIDFTNLGIGASNQSVTGAAITLPGVTNTNTTGTKTYTGVQVTAGSGLNQNGAGTTQFNGVAVTIPALTQSAGTITGNGILVTTPSSIATGGTANGINISASGVGAGALNGINISNITGSDGTETAIKVGTGWDYAAIFAGGNVGIGTISPVGKLHLIGSGTTTAPTLMTQNSTSTNFGLAVLDNGNVGIGTTNPLKKLHVGAGTDSPIATEDGLYVSNAGTTTLVVRDSTNDVEFAVYAHSSGVKIGAASNHTLALRTNNQDRVTIDTSGAVTMTSTLATTGFTNTGAFTTSGGIANINVSSNYATNLNTGTSTGAVSIGNSLAGALTLASGASSSLTITNANLTLSTTGASGANGVINLTSALAAGNTTTSAFNITTSTDLGGGDELFQVGDSAATFLTIKGDGNVGIGTTAPLAKLQIADYSSSIYPMIIRTDNATNGNPGILFTNKYWADNAAAGMAAIRAYDSAAQGGYLAFSTTTNSSGTGGTPTERLRIDATGNVGIGTTTVNSKLTVVGNAMISQSYSGLTVPTSGLFVEGNVGIGATTSSNKLDVWGNTRLAGTLTVDSTSTFGDNLTLSSGQFLAPNGTASTPSYSFTNDTDTGLRSIAANIVGLTTNGSGALQAGTTINGLSVNSSGNVGIGTTNPLNPLHVQGQVLIRASGTGTITDSNQVLGLRSAGLGYLGMRETTNNIESILVAGADADHIGGYVGTVTNHPFAIATNNIKRLYITTGGNIGIGTVSPTGLFHLKSTGTGTNRNMLVSSGAGLFTILDNGNVGIGTTVPGYKLDVSGDINTTGVFRVNGIEQGIGSLWTAGTGSDIYRSTGNVGIGFTSPDRTIQIASDINITSSIASLLGANGSQFAVTGSTAANLQKKLTLGIDTTDNYGVIQAGNTSGTAYSLALQPGGGNVGIGTTNPLALLHVGTNSISVTGDVSVRIEKSHSGGSGQYDRGLLLHSVQTANATGNLTELVVAPEIAGGVTQTTAYGSWIQPLTTGNIGTWYGETIAGKSGAGTITTAYGLYIQDQKVTGVTTGYGLYQSGASDTNYFAGNVGIGFTSPAATLDVIGTSMLRGTGGTLGLAVTSSGNVGIGTTAPGTSLHLYNSGGVGIKLEGAGAISNSIDFTSPDGFWHISGPRSYETGKNLAIFWNDGTYKRYFDINSSGNVGIGTGSPNWKFDTRLDLAKTNTGDNQIAFFGSNEAIASNPLGLLVGWTGGATSATRYTYLQSTEAGSTVNNLILQRFGGNVGIGTAGSAGQVLEVNGKVKIDDMTGTGGVAVYHNNGVLGITSSDIRLKKNLEPIVNALDIIGQVQGYLYNPIEAPEGTQKLLGVLAQDFLPILPEATFTFTNAAGEQFYGVHYEKLSALLIEGIKEQQTQINSLLAKASSITISQDGSLQIPNLKADKLVLGDIDLGSSIQRLASSNENYDSQLSIINYQLTINEASSSAALAAVSTQIATQSAELAQTKEIIATHAQELASAAAELVKVKSDVEELKLTPPDILLATQSAQLVNLSVTSDATISGKLTVYQATISDTFKALGQAILGKTTIAGDVSVDGTLAIENGSEINVLGTLYLQRNALADGLDIFNGKVKINPAGNIITAGEIAGASIVTNKLTIANSPIASSSAQLIPTIGSGKILTGQISAIISTSQVSATSKIFITPRGRLGNQALVIDSVSPGTSFTVSLDHTLTQDIDFDWWVVESK